MKNNEPLTDRDFLRSAYHKVAELSLENNHLRKMNSWRPIDAYLEEASSVLEDRVVFAKIDRDKIVWVKSLDEVAQTKATNSPTHWMLPEIQKCDVGERL